MLIDILLLVGFIAAVNYIVGFLYERIKEPEILAMVGGLALALVNPTILLADEGGGIVDTAAAKILIYFAEKYPSLGIALGAIGTLSILVSVVVKLTPTPADDEMLDKFKETFPGKVLFFFERFSLIKRK